MKANETARNRGGKNKGINEKVNELESDFNDIYRINCENNNKFQTKGFWYEDYEYYKKFWIEYYQCEKKLRELMNSFNKKYAFVRISVVSCKPEYFHPKLKEDDFLSKYESNGIRLEREDYYRLKLQISAKKRIELRIRENSFFKFYERAGSNIEGWDHISLSRHLDAGRQDQEKIREILNEADRTEERIMTFYKDTKRVMSLVRFDKCKNVFWVPGIESAWKMASKKYHEPSMIEKVFVIYSLTDGRD